MTQIQEICADQSMATHYGITRFAEGKLHHGAVDKTIRRLLVPGGEQV